MKKLNLLQIVPRLPPSICGVGDYASLLAESLQRNYNIESSYIVCDSKWKGKENKCPINVSVLAKRSVTDLVRSIDQINPGAMLVQYSNYGFHRRGIPRWLIEGLCIASKKYRVISFVHEISANGPIWSSSFWLRFEMNRLALKLARISSNVLTNRKESARFFGAEAIPLPVFSTFGEPACELPDWNEREPWVVCFGFQKGFSKDYFKNLRNFVQTRKIERILSLGRQIANVPRYAGCPEFEQLGIVDADKASSIFLKSRYGYLAYDINFLGKSSILAAYAAHKLAVYTSEKFDFSSEGLTSNEEIGLAGNIREKHDDYKLAANLKKWYDTHNLDRTAAFYNKMLRVNTPE